MIQAANYMCQECGKAVPDSHFELHHKIPIDKCDDPFEQSNLQVICKACHRKTHSEGDPETSAWNDLLISL